MGTSPNNSNLVKIVGYYYLYLPKHNYCNEFGSLQGFEKTKGGNKTKNGYYFNNGIELFRISYKERVVKVLNERL